MRKKTIEVNGMEVELTEKGKIRTEIRPNSPKILDEFRPLSDNETWTKISTVFINPNNFELITYKNKDYLLKELRENNKSFRALAFELNINESVLRREAREMGAKKPLDDPEYLQEKWEENDSVSETAKEIGEELYKVKIALEKHNII